MNVSSRTPKVSFLRACQPARATRARVVARAETDDKPAASSYSQTGFTDEDSAGQANIFAVEPKSYVAGGAKDTTDSSPTLLIGAIAGLIAVGVAVAGFAGNKANVAAVDTVYEDAGKYETLSTYVQALR